MVEHIIERVRTVGFKGFDLDEEVPSKVIYTGRNKSGKSSRAGAISIALYGHIPFSTVGKRPGDILSSFGSDHMVAAVTIGGTEFARKFSRNSKGGVTQSFQTDGKRTSSENFAILLNRAGNPRIADVAEFMKQSDAKKTDTLFDLFPNKELSGIDTEIETAKEDVSRLTKEKDGAESVVARLTKSKTDIEIPAGNIAETQAEIKKVEAEISDYEEQIKEAEIEEAKEKAEEAGRIEGERLEKERAEKGQLEIKRKQKIKVEAGQARHEILKKIGFNLDASTCSDMTESSWNEFFDSKNSEYQVEQSKLWNEEQKEKKDPIDEMISRGEQQIADSKVDDEVDTNHKLSEPIGSSGCAPAFESMGNILDSKSATPSSDFFHKSQDIQAPPSKPFDSIQRIIEALNGAGCGTCAALIVAKQELKKKYKGVS